MERRTVYQVHRNERGEEIYPVELRFDLPGAPMLRGKKTEAEWAKIFDADAQTVYDVLCRSLPAGTAVRLRALMEQRGASGWSMAAEGWRQVQVTEQDQ